MKRLICVLILTIVLSGCNILHSTYSKCNPRSIKIYSDRDEDGYYRECVIRFYLHRPTQGGTIPNMNRELTMKETIELQCMIRDWCGMDE